jgi:hypothetical protein
MTWWVVVVVVDIVYNNTESGEMSSQFNAGGRGSKGSGIEGKNQDEQTVAMS